MSLSNEFKYKSTPDGSPPSGYRRRGTFRDASFAGMKPEHIDIVDSECQSQGITRSAWVMKALGSPEGRELFHRLFEGTGPQGYQRIWREIEREISDKPLP